MSTDNPGADALHEADSVIEQLKAHSKQDYTPGRLEIARQFEYLWNGHSDNSTDFDGCDEEAAAGLRDIRIIQEDHWDQHMEHEDDRPTHAKMLFYSGVYVWFHDDTQ